MNVIPDGHEAGGNDHFLTSRRQAWFAFAMTFALMLFDFIDRQVIVSLFPHIKSEWGLSDKQLGSLVSIVSIVVGVGGLPVALLADRMGRVKSIVVMAIAWSLATISCMFTNNYSQLFSCMFWGIVVGRIALRKPRNKLPALSVLCLITSVIFVVAFGGSYTGVAQLKLIVIGGIFMNCTVGVVASIAMDVIHPGVRSTGAAVLSLFQNVFGLAMGPFLAGVISDRWGLQHAMTVIPLFSVLAAVFFIVSMRSYDADAAEISAVKLDVAPGLTGNLSTSNAV
ncbi:MFS transporter [Burkholderia sp. PU8-34]